MKYSPINRFRGARGRILGEQIKAMAGHLGRDIRILDVGGRPDYWTNVGLENISGIELLNYKPSELEKPFQGDTPPDFFNHRLGDARNLSDYADKSVDFIHSNSVIEHVGGWNDMAAMASELLRVGQAGWVQTPAYEFPVEPHFRAPFIHWFGHPTQARILSISLRKRERHMSLDRRRRRVEMINLLSKREMKFLFPDCPLHVERLALLAKSYTARWMPEGVPLGE